MVSTEILNSLDVITEYSVDSEISVMNALIKEYEKDLIMEAYIMESKKDEGILDQVKKKGKDDDNKFITVLMFIPRLIKVLAEKIKKAFEDSDVVEDFKKSYKKLTQSADMREKQARVDQLNKEFAGKAECYLDEKTGKIKFKRNGSKMLIILGWLSTMVLSTYDLFKKIKAQFDVTNETAIKGFIEDCKKILTGRGKTLSKFDVFEDGVDAIAETLGLFAHVDGEIAGLSIGIKDRIEASIRNEKIKDMPDAEKIKRKQQLTELSDNVSKITAIIGANMGIVSTVIKHIRMWCDIGDEVKKSNDRATEYCIDYIINKGYINRKAIEDNNKKGANESDAEWKARIDSIVRKKAKELYETDEDIQLEAERTLGDSGKFKNWKKEKKEEYVNAKKEAEAKEIAEAKAEKEKAKAEKEKNKK